MKAQSAHTARDTRTGRLFLLVELAHQMEMLDSAQLAPYLAMKAMMYWSCGHGGDFAVIVATQNLELAYAGCRQTKNLKIHATSTTKTTRESTAYASGHTQIQIYLNNARCCSAAFVRTGFMSTILAFHPPCSIQKMKKGSLCMMNWCARPVYLAALSSLSIQRL